MNAPLLPALPGYDNPELIAHGTTALVFRAVQTTLNRLVAIKVITVDTGAVVPVNAARELATTVALSSQPHIVSIIDTGVTEDDRPYIVMEYCEGGSYAAILRHSGPLPLVDVLEVGVKIGEALHAAHQVGIVHRDVKPSNILRSRFGPALTDFGIARAPDELGSTLTRELMTPHHASPEALLHQAQSGISDVYSLASTMWTLLVGHPPFVDPLHPAMDMYAFRDRVLHDDLPPIPRPDVPPWLVTELRRAMSKLPSARHRSALDFAESLRRGALGLGPSEVDPSPSQALASSGLLKAANASGFGPPTAFVPPPPRERPESTVDRSIAPVGSGPVGSGPVAGPAPITAPPPSSPSAGGGSLPVIGAMTPPASGPNAWSSPPRGMVAPDSTSGRHAPSGPSTQAPSPGTGSRAGGGTDSGGAPTGGPTAGGSATGGSATGDYPAGGSVAGGSQAGGSQETAGPPGIGGAGAGGPGAGGAGAVGAGAVEPGPGEAGSGGPEGTGGASGPAPRETDGATTGGRSAAPPRPPVIPPLPPASPGSPAAGRGARPAGAPPAAVAPSSTARPSDAGPGSPGGPGGPGSGRPGAGRPGAGRPGAGGPDAGGPGSGRPGAGGPGAGRSASGGASPGPGLRAPGQDGAGGPEWAGPTQVNPTVGRDAGPAFPAPSMPVSSPPGAGPSHPAAGLAPRPRPGHAGAGYAGAGYAEAGFPAAGFGDPGADGDPGAGGGAARRADGGGWTGGQPAPPAPYPHRQADGAGTRRPDGYTMIAPPPNRRGILVGVLVAVAVLAVAGAAVLILVAKDRGATAGGAAAQTTVAAPSGAPQTTKFLTNDPLGAPTNTKLADHGTEVTVTWSDPSPGSAPFIVIGNGPNGEQLPPRNVDRGTTTATFPQLSPTKNYCFRVGAIYSATRVSIADSVCTKR